MKFQFRNCPGTRGAVPVVTRGMVRKVRKALGPKWRMCNLETLEPFNVGPPKRKMFRIGFLYACSSGLTWSEAFDKAIEGAKHIRSLQDNPVP